MPVKILVILGKLPQPGGDGLQALNKGDIVADFLEKPAKKIPAFGR